jgi:hypothetical protein
MDPERPTLDRRALLARMAAGGAVVWASPMMQSVASAQAEPSCGAGILDWDTFATGTIFTSTTIGNVTVSITAVPAPGTSVNASNRQVTAPPSGGVNEKYLRFDMDPDDEGDNQVITITWSAPISNLSFRLFDIDRLADGWRDEIFILTPGYTWSIPPGSFVQKGTGANIDRFRSSQTINYPDTSDDGNLILGHNGPITSFSFRYRNGNETGGANQYVGLGDLTFTC